MGPDRAGTTRGLLQNHRRPHSNSGHTRSQGSRQTLTNGSSGGISPRFEGALGVQSSECRGFSTLPVHLEASKATTSCHGHGCRRAGRAQERRAMPPRRSPIMGAKGTMKRQATAANRSPRPEHTKAAHGCWGAGAGHPWGRAVEVLLMLAKGFLRDGRGGARTNTDGSTGQQFRTKGHPGRSLRPLPLGHPLRRARIP